MTCRRILECLENNPPLDGYLSIKHGFMPPSLPLDRLSKPFSIWDQHVALIPELYFSNQTQEILSAMPVLATEALPDAELPRAALVLSLLAHAYWRHGSQRAFSVRMSDIDGALPESIKLPWEAVNERLGRGSRPYQSFYDLFLNNFALRSTPGAQGAYSHLEKLIFIRSVITIQYQHVTDKKLNYLFMSHAHTHFIHEHLDKIIEAIPNTQEDQNELAGLGAWNQFKNLEFISNQDLRGLLAQEHLAQLEAISRSYEKDDLQLVDDLINYVLKVLEEECYADAINSGACFELIKKWAASHLNTIELIKQQEISR